MVIFFFTTKKNKNNLTIETVIIRVKNENSNFKCLSKNIDINNFRYFSILKSLKR